ncbi:hypothetical protein AVEN_81145-1 [Araneus ventricosus]|uniref:Uncharacterized protein n=1 Tax=Araneus ventricosus TaxID=182803 RepID=A0A4Y2HR46_ARAVE|nr:hypothetical protein AVEN_81145-1 [Araneus ventricosus]
MGWKWVWHKLMLLEGILTVWVKDSGNQFQTKNSVLRSPVLGRPRVKDVIIIKSDSGRVLNRRGQGTRSHLSNIVERHSYRAGGIMVWAGISLDGLTDSMCSI